jgi:hypothetical protein
MAQSKHPLTDDQKATIRKAPVVEDAKPAAPVITFAVIADRLRKAENAGDMDALDMAADLIGEVADPEQRRELSGIYEAARNKITE